jgi:hypothetical protein
MTELDQAEAALNKQGFSAALSILLEYWRKSHHPQAGSCIAQLGKHFSPLPYQTPTGWLEQARSHNPMILSSLMAQGYHQPRIFRERLVALKTWPADPRIADTLIGILEKLPPQIRLSRPHTHIVGALHEFALLLPVHADASHYKRLCSIPKEFKEVQYSKTQGLIGSLLLSLCQRLKVLPEPEPSAQLERILSLIPAPPLHSSMPVPPIEDAHAVQVYADFLQEQGNPRGEFIALQRHPSPEAQERAERLLKRHSWTWLGSLADVLDVSSVRWEGGFPVEATLIHGVDPAFTHPDLQSFHTLRGPAPPTFLVQPALRNLKKLENIPLVTALAMATGKSLPITSLQIYEYISPPEATWTSQFLQFCSLPGFSMLSHLSLRRSAVFAPRHLSQLWALPRIQQLQSLKIASIMANSAGALLYLEQIPKESSLQELIFIDYYYPLASFRFLHGKTRWSTLEITLPSVYKHMFSHFVGLLRQLPAEQLVELRFKKVPEPKGWILPEELGDMKLS